MAESAESSLRFDFSEVDKKSPSGKEGKSDQGKSGGFPFKVFRSWSDGSNYRKEPQLRLPARQDPSGTRLYSYEELDTATNGFSPKRIVRVGSNGVVYRGTLRGHQEVAIKLRTVADRRGISLCRSEIRVMNKVRHRNVVRLLGWCEDVLKVALVFESMPNGSLADHLGSRASLPWNAMYWRVAVGLASALLYLHEGLDHCVVHGGVKPCNVWLDAEGNPKLAGFEHSVVVQRGGAGSESPTAGALRTVSTATDVYDFGKVALQMARSRASAFDAVGNGGIFPQELHEKGKGIDRDMSGEMDESEVERFFSVGQRCTQSDPESRPSMKVVLQLLNFEIPLPATNFAGHEFETSSTEHEAPSSPVLFPPEVIKNIDAAATSTESKTDIDEDTTSESIQDNYPEDEHAMFDIGIPPDYGSAAGVERSRKDSHRSILKGFADSLHEMMRSEENLPRFDEALAKIKVCTAALVATVGPPLDDWNALAQLVLRFLKEREDFCKICAAGAPPADEECAPRTRSISEDERELEDCRERLALARERCRSLEADLARAQEMSSAMEEEVMAVERRITPERRRRHGISRRYRRVLSELSDFACYR